jgi:predicted sulfurtransferase
LNYITNIAKNHRPNIGGRIRVSIEGVNATVSAASTTSTTTSSNGNLEPEFEAAQTLRHFAQDLRQFDPVAFSNTDFKYVDGLSADRHFKELKLLPVKELVFYGIKEEDCSGATVSTAAAADASSSTGKEVKGGGVHLDAIEYHEMLKRKDAVVIDVRNHYEAAIGRFDGQMEKESKEQKGNDGAEYIDPKMRKSTDFTSWLAEPETKQKLEGKTVLMFCTGECQ